MHFFKVNQAGQPVLEKLKHEVEFFGRRKNHPDANQAFAGGDKSISLHFTKPMFQLRCADPIQITEDFDTQKILIVVSTTHLYTFDH